MQLDNQSPVSRECAYLVGEAITDLLKLGGNDELPDELATALGMVRAVLEHGLRVTRGRLHALVERVWRAARSPGFPADASKRIQDVIRQTATKIRALPEDSDIRTHRDLLPHAELVPLPKAPKSTSPVPWLTSIYARIDRGPYGNPEYPGNCPGYLIRDLLVYFKAARCLDPMTGSGTCRDVCKELGILCHSGDIRDGFDAADSANFRSLGEFDFVWLHPPYWKMKKYGSDPRCLGNASSLEDFLSRLRAVVGNCVAALKPEGKLAVLMADYTDRGRFLPLTHHTLSVCMAEGLEPVKEIVKFQHNTESAVRSYPFPLIPTLHETCIILKHAR